MPIMDLPLEPVKPKIHWVMLAHENKPFVALTMPEALELLEYLYKERVIREQYQNRIESMNKLLVK